MTERDIFTICLQFTDPDARSAYVAQACGGDEHLRRRVEILLRLYDRADDFLARPAVAQIADALSRLRRSADPSPYPGRTRPNGDTAIH
jgi:hypothetical protein